MSAPAPGTQSAPWYTQFWPWFILSLLGLSVMASLTAVALAVHGADPEVRRDFAVDGKAIHKLTGAEDLAASLGIGALLSVDASGRRLSLESWTSASDLPSTLLVHFAHPTLAADDRTVVFTRGSDGMHHVELAEAMEGRWEVVVSPVVVSVSASAFSPAAGSRNETGRWEIVSRASLSPGAEVALGSARPGSG